MSFSGRTANIGWLVSSVSEPPDARNWNSGGSLTLDRRPTRDCSSQSATSLEYGYAVLEPTIRIYWRSNAVAFDVCPANQPTTSIHASSDHGMGLAGNPYHQRSEAMAYYDFECDACRKQFTCKQSFAEHNRESKPKCPKCGSRRKVRQVFTVVHVKTSRKS